MGVIESLLQHCDSTVPYRISIIYFCGDVVIASHGSLMLPGIWKQHSNTFGLLGKRSKFKIQSMALTKFALLYITAKSKNIHLTAAKSNLLYTQAMVSMQLCINDHCTCKPAYLQTNVLSIVILVTPKDFNCLSPISVHIRYFSYIFWSTTRPSYFSELFLFSVASFTTANYSLHSSTSITSLWCLLQFSY